MKHGPVWHECDRWTRFGFVCPVGWRRVGAPLLGPERHDDWGDEDYRKGPRLGMPERRKGPTGRGRSVESMVNEVLDAMAAEAFRQFSTQKWPQAPVPALMARAMVEAVQILRGRGSVASPGSIEEALAGYAAERVRAVARLGRTIVQVPWWRGLDFNKGPAQAIAVGAGVAGGGFLINWARRIRMAPLTPLPAGSGAPGSGAQN